MRVTLDIRDGVARDALALAQIEHRTLDEITEEALQRVVADSKSRRVRAYAVDGSGLVPGVTDDAIDQVRDWVYSDGPPA